MAIMSRSLVIKQVGGCGDTLEAAIRCGELYVECDEPWAGDTVSGIGRTASVTLTKDQARELAAFLLDWANESA